MYPQKNWKRYNSINGKLNHSGTMIPSVTIICSCIYFSLTATCRSHIKYIVSILEKVQKKYISVGLRSAKGRDAIRRPL